MRLLAMSRYSRFKSVPTLARPRLCATASVVPLPAKQSSTVAGTTSALQPQVGCQPRVCRRCVAYVLTYYPGLSAGRVFLAVVRAVSVAAAGGLPAEGLAGIAVPAFRTIAYLVYQFVIPWVIAPSLPNTSAGSLRLPNPRRAAVSADAPLAGSRKDAPPGQFVRKCCKMRVGPALRGNRPDVPGVAAIEVGRS